MKNFYLHYMSTMVDIVNDIIYTVVTMRQNSRSRCVGWFPNKEDAIEVIIENYGDINEAGYYPYALVEGVKPGLYNFDLREEIWFKWDDDKHQYIQCDKPDKFHNTLCYSMG